jgi:hypothetical protein
MPNVAAEEIRARRKKETMRKLLQDKIERFSATLKEQRAESARRDQTIRANLRELGYGH